MQQLKHNKKKILKSHLVNFEGNVRGGGVGEGTRIVCAFTLFLLMAYFCGLKWEIFQGK
jgi:hypothetical protein